MIEEVITCTSHLNLPKPTRLWHGPIRPNKERDPELDVALMRVSWGGEKVRLGGVPNSQPPQTWVPNKTIKTIILFVLVYLYIYIYLFTYLEVNEWPTNILLISRIIFINIYLSFLDSSFVKLFMNDFHLPFSVIA